MELVVECFSGYYSYYRDRVMGCQVMFMFIMQVFRASRGARVGGIVSRLVIKGMGMYVKVSR